MFCKKCQYSLEKLIGPRHRCPECGEEFDPKDRASFLTNPEFDARKGRDGEFWAGVILAAFILIILFWAHGH